MTPSLHRGVDRRLLQFVAAFALLVGLLGVSTALVSQVRQELLEAGEAQQEIDLEGADSGAAGLPIHEFTLLDPADATIPSFVRAGNIVRVTANGTLFLEAGDSIQVSPVPVPGGSALSLPRGGLVEGTVLRCPAGCDLLIGPEPAVLPTNASLVFPSSHAMPRPEGPVEAGTTLNLPPAARINLEPMTMARDTQVTLQAGSTLILPAGTADEVTREGPGGGSVLLPKHTVVRGPLGGPLGGDDAKELLESTAPPPAELPQTRSPPGRAIIEITEWPETISKGVPFQIGGTVHRPDGSPSPGHPVTLYANATKERPGFEIAFGEVLSGPDGTWRAQASIPRDRPARPYHIVGKAEELPAGDPPLLVGWSDPVVNVEASPRLLLGVPETEGVRVPVAFQARLEDEHRAPVPAQEVVFTLEGSSFEARVLTDETGEAVVVFSPGFPTAGTYTVAARFEGTESLEPASAKATIEVIEAQILTDPTLLVPRGETATLTGQVRVDGFVDAGRVVKATYANLEAETITDDRGFFDLSFPVPSTLKVGNYTMTLETVGVTAKRSVILTVTGRTLLEAAPPPLLPLGGTLPLSVRATDELGNPIPGLALAAQSPHSAVVRGLTGEDGRTVLPVSLATPGSWELVLTTKGTPLLAPGTERVVLKVGAFDVRGNLRFVPGVATNQTLQLLVSGDPFAGEPVELQGPGFVARALTDPEGRATFTTVPAPRLEPGSTEVGLLLQRYNTLQHLLATVLDQPRLDVDVLSPGADGEDVRVRVVALGQSGFLAELPLVVEAAGAFEGRVEGRTGPDGSAILTLDRPRGAEGLTVLTVTSAETEALAPTVAVAEANVSAAPFPWWLLAPLPVVAAAVYALRRSRAREPRPAPPGPSLELSIVPQSAGLPPVWHPGESTTLRIRLADAAGQPIAGARIEFEGPQGRRSVALDPDGEAFLPVPPGDGRLLSFDARFRGEGPHRAVETSLDVRLVDYREEIDREYRALRREAAERGLCGEDATPHELARGLGGSREARRLALLFERCDYSLHPVDRSHYEEFMKAKEASLRHGGRAG